MSISFLGGELRRAGRRAVDLLLPPLCLRCGTPVDDVGALCAACWVNIGFIAPPFCACCGYPFEFDPGPDSVCAGCTRARPRYARARAVFRYDDFSRDLVLGFKHADRTDAAPAFGRWLARAGGELVADADLIVPVPLHWLRLFQRRYNQAALLALALARTTGVAAAPSLLRRRRSTPSQGRLGRLARRRNVAGAFRIDPRQGARIEDRRVLLIDDVLTTGATAEACAAALLQAGAAAVDVLTLARVVRPAA
jgi:ComF family protein